LLTDNLSKSKFKHETAASILAALIKSKKKSGQKVDSSIKNNNWWEQNYE